MLSLAETRSLDRLALGSAGTAAAAHVSGIRRARSRGLGGEFHDVRHYQPGDDPRSIDWTVEARLRQLVVRVAKAQGQLRLHLLVDTSASMSIGTPDKLSCAKTLAAALTYLAIEGKDAVGVATFDETVRTHIPPAAGRGQMFRIFEAMRSCASGGRSRIDQALVDYGSVSRGGGLVVVLSDFFESNSRLEGLRFLLHRGLTPAIVQIVAPEELAPPIDDEEIEIFDVEDAAAPPVVVDRTALDTYRARMTRLSADLADFSLSHGLPWLQLDASSSFDLTLGACQRAGLVTTHM